ncbi:hypothetical protein I302_106717 [Kwoniella bestiolae CBS 10118]|uniref:Uncharacterized protein n=1 Tax=Kwoniella bestiolae CBS 10118 TaxID=1296100 RepID=A0A1B9G0L5_9TREE|nr:hypothetical protein I302_06019 [Kwoniella bestiolae CBS 10118]OCF24558.1 hypothetical protein I302_06019 [Kwoniella bestiolae CBS 10118]
MTTTPQISPSEPPPSNTSNQPITSPPPAESKPTIKPFISAPQGEGTRNQPLGSEALGNPCGCGPDAWGKWLMACARC